MKVLFPIVFLIVCAMTAVLLWQEITANGKEQAVSATINAERAALLDSLEYHKAKADSLRPILIGIQRHIYLNCVDSIPVMQSRGWSVLEVVKWRDEAKGRMDALEAGSYSDKGMEPHKTRIIELQAELSATK